jgi:hypothetical protein
MRERTHQLKPYRHVTRAKAENCYMAGLKKVNSRAYFRFLDSRKLQLVLSISDLLAFIGGGRQN